MDSEDFSFFNISPSPNRRSSTMAMASLILGVASLISSGCIYLALVCGSLGIILALLSRGGTKSLDTQATTGLLLSCAGLILTILIYATMFWLMWNIYGGIDGIMQEYMNIYGVETIEELYEVFGL